MIENAVRQLLSECAQQTLETMFFAAPDAIFPDAARPAGELIAASLTFQGDPPGRFGVVLSSPLARTMAINFLGLEDDAELPPSQVNEVVGEMTNIICGAVLSELESNANFDISTPAPRRVGETEPLPDHFTGLPFGCRMELPEGSIVVSLFFEDAA
jgi:chemotaxis protein CheY-P-specific phosphatase CheC